ncbi:polycystic kidney disease 2-like 1 protein [Rhagoletis pomonella]|uniref:polycystic kidney disease 2-like 1 protein n=1 Tax=Rhagoletis pomonella TaxID=28610 RepID=UPI00177A82D1|nr:polycystic kidney disease 2-like 1 protein [Rhagoletis pomonella]
MNFETNVKYDSEKNIRRALGSITLYCIFIVVTTAVAVSVRHHYLYYFNYAIKRHFMIYERVVTYEEWWSELAEVFVPEVLQEPQAEENDDDTTTGGDASGNRSTKGELNILHENMLLGIPRLRQIRVEAEECSARKSFVKHFHGICYPIYSYWNQQTKGEHVGTEYGTASDLDTMPVSGRMHTYWGGGFVQHLSRDLNASLDLVVALAQLGWLDRGTRLIIFEFTLYNHNTDLFNNVKILGEVPATGGVLLFLEVKTVQKYAVWTGSIWIILAAVIFYLIALYYLIGGILAAKKQGCKKYIKNFWNLCDIVISKLVSVSFSYNIFHPFYLRYYLKEVEAKPTEYHSLDVICWLNKNYMNLMAVLAFLVWVKVFQFFNFNETALRLNMTFVKCYRDLLNFVVIFLILFLSYAVLGMLLFGDAHQDFVVFPLAFWSVMRMVLADFDYVAVERANRVLGPLYFLSFIIIVYFILINMFLAIIFDTFRDIKKIEIPLENNQLSQFFKKYWDKGKAGGMKALNTIGLCKPSQSASGGKPLRDVGAENEPPFPPRPKTKKIKVTKDEILRNYFEVVNNKRDAEQIDRLTKHIAALEEILAKMGNDIKHLEAETPDPSTRPEPPRQVKAPPRIKVFIDRKK